MLADLPQHERGAQAILIEAECPDKAEDEAMAVRRLGFMPGAGLDTGFTEHLFDAWFRILVLDCPGAGTFADRQAVDALVDCYRRTISETRVVEVRAVLLPGRNKILLRRRRSVQIMCTERPFAIFLLTDSQKVGTPKKHNKTLSEEGNIMAEK